MINALPNPWMPSSQLNCVIQLQRWKEALKIKTPLDYINVEI
jgi:hypothetical protein